MAKQLERRIGELEQRSPSLDRPASEWTTPDLEAFVSGLLGVDRPATVEELQQLLAQTEGDRS